jgi:hypothetical protein
MKKHVAKKWIKALRSGKFEQGKKMLQTISGRYCCLGVLCEIAPKSVEKWRCGKYLAGVHLGDQLEVKRWAGMKSDQGYYYMDLPPLSIQNDIDKTFVEIADLIEKEWKNL